MNLKPLKRSYYWLLASVPFVLVLVIWVIATHIIQVRSYFLPKLSSIPVAGFKLFSERNFIYDVIISIYRIGVGFALTAIIAIPTGVLIGYSRIWEALLEPITDFIRYTPLPAYIPLFILWLGIGDAVIIFVIINACFLQLILLTADEIRSVPQEYLDIARTLGAKNKDVILRVLLHSAAPGIFDSCRITLGLAWTSLILAEILGATSGIGYMIIRSQRYIRTENIFFCIAIVGLMGLFTDYTFKFIYKKTFPWSEKT